MNQLLQMKCIACEGAETPLTHDEIQSLLKRLKKPWEVLNDKKIAIRSGHHCAQVLMDKLKVPATCRISFYIYNNKDDIDKVVEALKEVKKVFN